jgi:hypothetical protein
MTLADYIVSLYLIVIGLAVTDMAASLHRLLNDTEKVEWDGQFLLMLFIVTSVLFWIVALVWVNRAFLTRLSYPVLITYLLEMVLLYLLAAASLPDRASGRFSLRQFYERKARYIWTLLSLLLLSINAHTVQARMMLGDGLGKYWLTVLIFLAMTVVTLTMAIWPRRRALHWPLLAIVAGWLAWGMVMLGSLTGPGVEG